MMRFWKLSKEKKLKKRYDETRYNDVVQIKNIEIK